jgi:hypothetical protein
MLTLIHTERRGAGWAYAGICHFAYPRGTLVAALQRHAIASHPWQGRVYTCFNRQCTLLWESAHTSPAQSALDALLEYLAPYGLPDDLYPLVNALLPQGASEPVTAPSL